MLYSALFLIRFFPFWAVPLALVFFEVGVYHYNRRVRHYFVPFFLAAFIMVVLAIIWIAFEGYWRAGPFLKPYLE